MEPLVIASLRALRSTFAPGMFSIFLWSILITIGALISFIFIAGGITQWVATYLNNQLWATALPWIGSFGATMMAWFLFPGIMPIIVNFFDARIAKLIEQRDYPANVAAYNNPFWTEFWHDVRFSLMAILLNILILPLYLLMPGLHFIPFFLLNGYLLGREFFVMAARRHIPIRDAHALRLRHGKSILFSGIIIAVFATLPVLNLIAPFWGVAVMVHLYHQLTNTPNSQLLQ
jgi:CysZ protein